MEQKDWKEKSVAGKMSEQIAQAKIVDKVDEDTKDEISGFKDILRSFCIIWNVFNAIPENKGDTQTKLQPEAKNKFLTYNGSVLLGISDAQPMSMNIEAFEAATNLVEAQKMVSEATHIGYERKEGLARASPVIIEKPVEKDGRKVPEKVIIIGCVYLTPIPGATKEQKVEESKILEIANDLLRITGAGTLSIQDFAALDPIQKKIIDGLRFDDESMAIAKSAVVDTKIVIPTPVSKFNNEKQRVLPYKHNGGEDDNKEIKEMDKLLDDTNTLEGLMNDGTMRKLTKTFLKPVTSNPTEEKFLSFDMNKEKLSSIKDEEYLSNPKVKELIGKKFTLPYAWCRLVKLSETEISELAGTKSESYKKVVEKIEKMDKETRTATDLKMKSVEKDKKKDLKERESAEKKKVVRKGKKSKSTEV